jgi:hypothetical protein
MLFYSQENLQGGSWNRIVGERDAGRRLWLSEAKPNKIRGTGTERQRDSSCVLKKYLIFRLAVEMTKRSILPIATQSV